MPSIESLMTKIDHENELWSLDMLDGANGITDSLGKRVLIKITSILVLLSNLYFCFCFWLLWTCLSKSSALVFVLMYIFFYFIM